MHCNVFLSSIYVEKSDEWRLAGLELVSSMNDDTPSILVRSKNHHHKKKIDLLD
jgi:hypothetical protein